jgi:hypothetical protein
MRCHSGRDQTEPWRHPTREMADGNSGSSCHLHQLGGCHHDLQPGTVSLDARWLPAIIPVSLILATRTESRLHDTARSPSILWRIATVLSLATWLLAVLVCSVRAYLHHAGQDPRYAF